MSRFSKEGFRLLAEHLSVKSISPFKLCQYRQYSTWREFKRDYPITHCYCEMGLYHWETRDEVEERMAAPKWKPFHDLIEHFKTTTGFPLNQNDWKALDELHDQIDIARLIDQLKLETTVIPIDAGKDGFIIKRFNHGGFYERWTSRIGHLKMELDFMKVRLRRKP